MADAGHYSSISFYYGALIDGYDAAKWLPNIGFYNANGSYLVLRESADYAGGGYVRSSVAIWARSLNEGSDRNLKTNIEPVDPTDTLQRVLSLPVSTWAFRDEVNTRHVGPMAQDFRAAFGLGNDDKTIGPRDANGVALAAIQGLNQKLEEKNAALAKQVAELTALVKALAEKVNGGGQ